MRVRTCDINEDDVAYAKDKYPDLSKMKLEISMDEFEQMKAQKDAMVVAELAKIQAPLKAEIKRLSEEREHYREKMIDAEINLGKMAERYGVLELQNKELREALLAEIHGTACSDDCAQGYRHCTGCEARIKKALEVK